MFEGLCKKVKYGDLSTYSITMVHINSPNIQMLFPLNFFFGFSNHKYAILMATICFQGCDINCDEEINILDCNCDNNIRTKESCLKRKNFTKVCFQNG